MSEQQPHDIQHVRRYNLYYTSEFPMAVPWFRGRDASEPWRCRLLESIREEGLRHPIIVFGHSPKGRIIDKYRCAENAGRDESIYISQGTNRYWCLRELGWKSFPAVYSWNKGLPPPFGGRLLEPEEFVDYCPDDTVRAWVREHNFGYKQPPTGTPEVEFG